MLLVVTVCRKLLRLYTSSLRRQLIVGVFYGGTEN